MLKNSKILLVFALLVATLAPLLAPVPSYAVDLQAVSILSEPDASGNRTVCPGEGLTTRMIACVRDSIIIALNETLGAVSKYFATAVTGAITLAVLFFGIRVMGGAPMAMTRETYILALKIAAVSMFTANFGGYFPVLLDSMEYMVAIVAQPVIDSLPQGACHVDMGAAVLNVWDMVDCSIEQLIGGIFSPLTLSAGIVGFLVAAILSTSVGLFIALAGFYMIGVVLLAIARCLYIFITAYIAIAVLVMISPLFVPMILFRSTKQYFDKWVKLLITFILQPIFMFAFLVMFLIAFNTSIYNGKYSLYYAIAGQESMQPNFALGTWMRNNGVYKQSALAEEFQNINNGIALETSDDAAKKAIGDQARILANNKSADGVSGVVATTENARKIMMANVVNPGSLAKSKFFKTSIPFVGIDWKLLAEHARPVEYSRIKFAATCVPKNLNSSTTDADAWNCKNYGITPNTPQSSIDIIEKFYQDYKMKVLLSFIMSLLTIYIFYSMLEYLPYVSSGVGTEGGKQMQAFGTGSMGVPGTRASSGGGKGK